jgi:hypothetical protein
VPQIASLSEQAADARKALAATEEQVTAKRTALVALAVDADTCTAKARACCVLRALLRCQVSQRRPRK